MKLVPIPRDDDMARELRWQIAAQRRDAHSNYRLAWWAERAGLRAVAHRLRHDARQAFRMAAKQQRGLDTGAYRRGVRQYPAVEDMCGCPEYCHRPERR